MAIDPYRVLAVAIETAFEDDHDRRRRGSGVKAVAAGAALATGARLAGRHRHRLSALRMAKFGISKLTGASKLADATKSGASKLRDVPDLMRERFGGHEDDEDSGDDRGEEFEEPEAQAGDEPDEDYEDEEDDDYDDEEEDDDGDYEDDEGYEEDDRDLVSRLAPAARPPEPPEHGSDNDAQPKTKAGRG